MTKDEMFIIMQYFMLNFTIQTVIRTCIHDAAFDILGAKISLLKDSLTNRYFLAILHQH